MTSSVTRRRTGRFPAIATVCLGMTLAVLPLTASAAPQNEIVLAVVADGTAPFTADDPLDDGTGAAHTPGQDENATNGVVRTRDTVTYLINWNVNEEDGTNVVLSATLPPDVEWAPDPTTTNGLPAGCDGGSITGNGGRDLVCELGAQPQGSNGSIRPLAVVTGATLRDGDPIALTASITTDQLAAVVSNQVDLEVSSAPTADWLKGAEETASGATTYEADEIYYDVDNGGVLGRVYLWNIRLDAGADLRGSEPIVDATPIQFFDHGFDLSPSAVLATGLVPDGRTACGWFDGVGPYPAGSQGTITCTDVTGGSPSPIQQIDISGHDTQSVATTNADLSTNTATLLSAQVAYWMPETELVAAAAGGNKFIRNAVSGSAAAVTGTGAGVTPIQIAGTAGSVDEATIDNNVAADEFQPIPPIVEGLRGQWHWLRLQNGPYQRYETTPSPNSGVSYHGFDRRFDGNGGTQASLSDGVDSPFLNTRRWDGDGVVARGTTLTATLDMLTYTSANRTGPDFLDPVATCLAYDPTHLELVPLPATVPVSIVEGQGDFAHAQSPTIATTTVTPTTSIVDVVSGDHYSATGFFGNVGGSGPSSNVGTPANVIVEVAAGLVTPSGVAAQFGTTCNQSDADGRGWVDASNAANLAVFDTDTNGTYEQITLIRVRSAGDVDWTDNLDAVGTEAFGWQVNVALQVKTDPVAQAVGSEFFIHSSRAWGDWDPTVDDQPPTADCFSGAYRDVNGVQARDNARNPSTGWCNLDFADDGATTPDDYDGRAYEASVPNFGPIVAHSDVASIVDAQLAVAKENVDGVADIVDNGDIVEFEVRVGVTGSPIDSVSNVRIFDPLVNEYEFVQFTQQPATAGANCSGGGSIFCTFGTQNGGWTDTIRYEVRVTGAAADSALRNRVLIQGNDPITNASKQSKVAFAYSYTNGLADESAILKRIDQPIGTCPRPPADITDPADCSLTFSNGNVNYTLDIVNEGNGPLINYRLVDVLPFVGDGTEPASGTGITGDGRTPASAFTGNAYFDFLTGTNDRILYTADAPGTISRDPDVTVTANTWCDAPAGGTAVFGSGTCPAAQTDVTAVYTELGDLAVGETRNIRLGVRLSNLECDDIVTNTFGARTDSLALPIRSNDVSAMVGCVDLELQKALSANQTGAVQVGETIDFDITVNNQGPDAARLFDVTDHLPTWLTYQSDTNANTAVVNGQDVTWTYGFMSNNGSDTFTVTALVNAAPTATTNNYAEVTRMNQGDTDSSPADDNPVPVDTNNDGVPDRVTGDPAGPTNPPDEDDEAVVPLVVQFGDIVFRDDNGDGIQDPGEPPVSGVTIELRDAAGDPVLDAGGVPVTATTGADGLYLFNVLPGIYTARFDPTTIPAGTQFTGQTQGGDTAVDSNADPITGLTAPIDLSDPAALLAANGDTNGDGIPEDLTIDAGIRDMVQIGDIVFGDTNNDGLQTPGEPPVPGVVVNLLDEFGNPALDDNGVAITTTTGSGGEYLFTVPEGRYIVEFVPASIPAGTTFATQNVAGGDDALDSDADPTTGRTGIIDVTDNSLFTDDNGDGIPDDLTHDAGITPTYKLGDTVFLDANDDGIQAGDPTEPGVPNVVVNLLDGNGDPLLDPNGDPITTTTDGNGNYEFDVVPGDYQIEFEYPDGFLGAKQLEGGDDTIDSNADPLTGRTPTITVTNADVPTVDAGIVPGVQIGNIVFGDTNADGLQTPSEPPVPGVTVNLLDALGNPVNDQAGNPITTTTGPDGMYLFNVPEGLYIVEFVPSTLPLGTSFTVEGPAGVDQDDSDANVTTGRTGVIDVTDRTLQDDSNGDGIPDDLSWDAGIVPVVRIGDKVFLDNNNDGQQGTTGEPGVSGVTVNLLDSNGDPVLDTNGDPRTTTTDGNGDYGFDVVPGDYQIEFEYPAGFIGARQNEGDPATDSNADPTTGITPTFTVGTTDDLTIDGGIVPAVQIGDVIFDDLDGDGVQGPTEPGVGGVTINLLDENGAPVNDQLGNPITTTTGPDGMYLFTTAPGTYIVEFDPTTLPADRVFTTQDAGTDDALDSDVDRFTGRTGIIDVSDPTLFTDDNGDGIPDDLTNDAGIVAPVRIGDFVFLDLNNDGVQGGTGEDGVPNVGVELLDGNGDPVLDENGAPITTSTGPNGEYGFDVIPGDYQIRFDYPAGFTGAMQNQGGDDLTDVDADPITGIIPTFTVGTTDDLSLDGGIVPNVQIGDVVFIDSNADGRQDSTDLPVPNVIVNLLDANDQPVLDAGGNPVTTTTDPAGRYLFDDLTPGIYKVEFVPTSLPTDTTFTTQGTGDDIGDSDADRITGVTPPIDVSDPSLLTDDNNDGTPDDLDNDAGIVVRVNIGDTVFRDNNDDGIQGPPADEPGVPGIVVSLLDGNGDPVTDGNGAPITTTTDANGNYGFNVFPGDYQLQFDVPTEFQVSKQDEGGADDNDSDTDPTGRIATFTVGSESDPTLDMGLVPLVQIGDFVWGDADADGIQEPGDPTVPGVTVRLLDENDQPVLDAGGQPITAVTGPDGRYLFTVPQGVYKVQFDPTTLPPGTSFTTQNVGDDALDSDADPTTGISDLIDVSDATLFTDDNDDGIPDDLTHDAGLVPVVRIGDTVFRDNDNDGVQDGASDPGVPGVLVELLDANGDPVLDGNGDPRTATTDANGNYGFDVVPGDYQIQFTYPAGFEGAKQNEGGDDATDSDADPTGLIPTFTIGITDDLTLDAGIVRIVRIVRIGDTVFRDNDNDGIQDGAADPGVPGVLVELLDANGDPVLDGNGTPVTTTTDGSGNYGFDVVPGDYQIQFTYPSGFQGAKQNQGGDDATDSDAGPTGLIPTFSVGDDDDLTLDGGITPLQRVGGVVWRDSNGNGFDDPGEPRTAGAVVTVRDVDGNVVGTVTTGTDGSYEFALPPGEYTITIQPPAGLVLTRNGGDSDADQITRVINITVVAGVDQFGLDGGVVNPNDLPQTGSSPMSMTFAGLIILFVGMALLVGTRRRRTLSVIIS